MSENRVVNALLEAIDNAPGEKLESLHVQRRLVYCQQVCPEWFKSCQRYGLEEWIDVMIRPGQKCPMMDAAR